MAKFRVNRMSFVLFCVLCLLFQYNTPVFAISCADTEYDGKIVDTPTNGGIREEIPQKFEASYKKWKAELLSTKFGRELWEKYADRRDFVLSVVVKDRGNRGAGTQDYLWNSDGKLVGATIVLGGKIDKGFPGATYYPVMNSITEFAEKHQIKGETLAATKFAHEFGHVNLTSLSERETVVTQNDMMPEYNTIFLNNGYNAHDPRLLELREKMGGTPTEIWENREYWGEENAMKFLLERVNEKPFFCDFLQKVNENITNIGDIYANRFSLVNERSQECKK